MNLQENIQRIKQVMGLNEDVVDMNTYDSNEDIIKNISIKGKTPDGNVLINMEMSMFIPTTKSEGLKHTLKVITEWDDRMRIVDVKHISLTDAEPNNKKIVMVWHMIVFKLKSEIFKVGLTVEDVMHNIYAPYRQHISDKKNSDNFEVIKQSVNEVIKAQKRSVRKLERMLQSAFGKDVQEPTNVEPEAEPTPEPKDKSIWTSSNSWASE